MNKENYTSREFSEKLRKISGRVVLPECDKYWSYSMKGSENDEWYLVDKSEIKNYVMSHAAYDILNDICVKYANEFFPGGKEYNESCAISIMKKLRNGKKQEAEDYILEHCLFNPKNHE